jgi:hypothetical protein
MNRPCRNRKDLDDTPFLKHVIVVGTPKGKALSYETLINSASNQARRG